MGPWIGSTAISLVLNILNILMALIFLDIVFAIASFIGLVLWAYFFLVVWSFKAEVEEGSDGRKGNVECLKI